MAEFRTIEGSPRDVERQLEDLPARSVVLDWQGDAWQKQGGLWYLADADDEGDSEGQIARYQPFRVLWEWGDDGKDE